MLGDELVTDEAIAEDGVVGMDRAGRVDEVGVVPLALRDRIGAPLVEGLLREAGHPTGHHHGDPVSGESRTSGYIILG